MGATPIKFQKPEKRLKSISVVSGRASKNQASFPLLATEQQNKIIQQLRASA